MLSDSEKWTLKQCMYCIRLLLENLVAYMYNIIPYIDYDCYVQTFTYAYIWEQ